MKRSSSLFTILSFALVMLSAVSARANDLFFNANYSGTDGATLTPIDGLLTLTANDVFIANIGGSGQGGYQITGISGTRNGIAITGLVPNPNFPAYYVVGQTQFDGGILVPLDLTFSGIAYLVGTDMYNLYKDNNFYYEYHDGAILNGGYQTDRVEVSFSQVPDATSTVGLLAIGMTAIGIYRRRKPSEKSPEGSSPSQAACAC